MRIGRGRSARFACVFYVISVCNAADAVRTNPQPAAGDIAKPTGSATSDDSETYRIAAGDILQISVWREPDASVPAVMVRPDGRIATPLLKDVTVMGLTPREAEKVIAESMSKLVRDPQVTVIVNTIRRVYVVGAVRKEGPIAFRYQMTVLQALSEAGGLAEDAKRKKISIMRTEKGTQARLEFNYDAVIKGQHLDQNVFVKPDDTIVVPR